MTPVGFKKRLAVCCLAVLGLVVSGVLANAYLQHIPVPCTTKGFFHGCRAVQESSYAQLFGIPIPLYGFGYYLVILVGQLVNSQRFFQRLHGPLLIWIVALAGFLFSLYLTFIEAFVLRAWCIWCVASGLLATAIFILLTWLRWRSTHAPAGST